MDKYDPFKVLDFIPHGRENSISMTELSVRMRCDKRVARAAVFNARKAGAVICSSCEGRSTAEYFQSTDVSDVQQFVAMMDKRMNSTAISKRSAEEFLKQHDAK